MTSDPNPYTPPEPIDDNTSVDDWHARPPGVLICPWCRQRVSFARVYWATWSKIECPHCRKIFQRKKRGLVAGVSESLLFMAMLLVPAVVSVLTLSFEWSLLALIVTLPLFLLADFMIDRQLAYLAKPK